MKFNLLKGKLKNSKPKVEKANPKQKMVKPSPASSAESESSTLGSVSSSTTTSEVDFADFVTITKTGLEDYGIYTGIKKDPTAKGGRRYMVLEPTLSKQDQENFERLRKMLMVELNVDLRTIKNKQDAEGRLKKKLASMIKKYDLDIPEKSLPKIYYHAVRDFTRFGKIDPLMHDKMIEEISCDGTNIPLYVWHREFESMPTNIKFEKAVELENFVRKMAYISGKHVSVANPIVDASLPDGSRINLTLGTEVTAKGSTFTIRHFKEDPITITDLIRTHTISADIGAFLWYIVEKRLTMLIAGGTASGKTTTLNAMGTFIPPGDKIVSIEDTPELNLPHENWIPAISRQTFTDGGVGEITQFDLLRAALRQRPDTIIVGETRGREAHTLVSPTIIVSGRCLIAGGTASGKTTTLNAMGTFIPPGDKIVSIEDTPELNLPHENWIPAISRQTFTDGGVGEITQFDLLRAALRQRPDTIIVGETRGREAHTLFQAFATGHGGFSSIHADSVDACITRLTSAPMEVPKVLLVTTLDVIYLQLKLRMGNKTVRRCLQISELGGFDEESGDILLNDVFKWDPQTDEQIFAGKSLIFDKIQSRYGLSKEKIDDELNKRKTVLEWMLKENVHEHAAVNKSVQEFYADPDAFYERKRLEAN